VNRTRQLQPQNLTFKGYRMSKKRKSKRRKLKSSSRRKSRRNRRETNNRLEFGTLEPRKLLAGDLIVDASGYDLVELQQIGSSVQVVDAAGIVLGASPIADIDTKVQIFNANDARIDSALQLDGNSLEIDATGSIVVTGAAADIDTTDVGDANDTPGAGNVWLHAPTIIIDQNASIDTDDVDDADGDITLLADDTSVFENEGEYHISLVDADLRGGTISITANGETLTSWGDLGEFSNVIAEKLVSATQLGLSSVSPISGQAKLHSADAKILLSNTTIVSSGEVNILAEARADASLDAIAIAATQNDGSGFLGAVGFGQAATDARVDLKGTSSIDAAGNVRIGSNAESIAEVNSQADGGARLGGDADKAFNISIAITNEDSNVVVEENASIVSDQGKIKIEALGKVVNDVDASVSLFQEDDNSSGAGLALALGVDTAVINADIAGSIQALTPAPDAVNIFQADPDTGEIEVYFLERPFVVGEKVTYDFDAGDGAGLERGREYVVYSATEPVAADDYTPGAFRQFIRLAEAITIDLDNTQTSSGEHTLTKLTKATSEADSSVDNFVHLPGLVFHSGPIEVTYLGPDFEENPDAAGIPGLEQNQSYLLIETESGMPDQYRLQTFDGTLLEFDAPDDRQAFYYAEKIVSFDPTLAIDNASNTIELGVDHGFIENDLVFYSTDPTRTVAAMLAGVGNGASVTQALPDAPVGGLQDEFGYRIVLEPDNAAKVLLATSTAAVGDGLFVKPNGGFSSYGGHRFLRDNSNVVVRAHLDAVNKSDAGAALSDEAQPWAEIAVGVAQGNTLNMISGGSALIDSLRSKAEYSGEVVSFDDGADGGSSNGKSTSEAAGSIAMSFFDHDVKATLRSGANIQSGSDFEFESTIQQATKISSVSETNRRGTGDNDDASSGGPQKEISAAIGVGIYNNDAQAIVEDGAAVDDQVTIDAAGSINIHAGIEYPLLARFSADAINPFSQLRQSGLEAFEKINDGSLGLSELLNVSTRTTAGSDGDELSLGGAVVVTDYTNNIRAWVGDAKINLGTGTDGDVSVTAELAAEIIEAGQMASMNLDMQGLLENIEDDPTEALGQLGSPFGLKGDKGIGGVALITLANNSTVAEVSDGAQIEAKRLNVFADSDFYNLSIVQTGATTTDLGFSASIAASDITSVTSASVVKGAKVVAGLLYVEANDNLDRVNIVGGFLKGKQVGIGTSIGVNVIDQTVNAFVGRQDTGQSMAAPTDVDMVFHLGVIIDAQADGDIFSLVMAGAVQGLGSGTDDNSSGASTNTKSNKIGSIAITAPVAVNDVTTNVSAYLDHHLSETTEYRSIDASSEVDIKAASIGASFAVQTGASPGKVSLAGAGAVAINTVQQNVTAFVKDSEIQQGDTYIRAYDRSSVEADAGGFGINASASTLNKAALSFGVSVAVNEVTGATTAELSNSSVSGRDVAVDAESTSTITGLSIAGGVSAKLSATGGAAFGGAGAAVQNVVSKTITADVIDSNVDIPTDVRGEAHLNVTATDATTVVADAGGVGVEVSLGAASRVSASASITPAFNEISNTVRASINNADVNGLDQVTHSVMADYINVIATSTSTIEAKSLAASVDVTASSSPNPGVVVGGSGSQNYINNTIEATVADTNLTTNRSTKVIAKDASTITASAEGASVGAIVSAGGTGGVAVGLSIARSDIDNDVKSTIERSSVSAEDITVIANDQAVLDTRAIATSVSATLAGGGTFSATGGGAEASNTSLSNIDALVTDSELVSTSSNSGSISVYGLTNANLNAEVAKVNAGVAGSAGGAGTIAVGAAVANNSIGFDADGNEQESGATAKIIDTPVTAGSINVEAGTHQPNADGVCYIEDDPTQRITAKVAANSVAVAGAAGVGFAGSGSGSRATNQINQNIHALIEGQDHSTTGVNVTAVDTSVIKSDVAANAIAAALTGGANGSLSVGLSLANNKIANDVAASIKDANLLPQDEYGGDVSVSATESSTIDATSIAVGVSASVSGGLGIAIAGGGASSINEVANTTDALVEGGVLEGFNPTVVATSSTDIDATVHSHSVSAAGGGGTGVAASIGVALADNRIGGTEVNGDSLGPAGISAIVRDTTISANGDVVISAESTDNVNANIDANTVAAAVGTTAGAGAGAGASAYNQIETTIESKLTQSTVSLTGGDLEVTSNDNADANANVDSNSVAFAAGFTPGAAIAISIAAAKAENSIDNEVLAVVSEAEIDDDGAGSSVTLQATENANAISDATTNSVAVSFGGSISGGGAHAISDVQSKADAKVEMSDLSLIGSVDVDANNTATADADTRGVDVNVALAALAGRGSVAEANVTPNTNASVALSEVDADGGLFIDATATPQTTADARGFSIGTGLTVGVSSATTSSSGTVNAKLEATNSNNLGTLEVNATLNDTNPSHATATASGGGLLIGSQSSFATTDNDISVNASAGQSSDLVVDGDAAVNAEKNVNQTATATSNTGGIIAAGVTIANANITGNTTASIAPDTTLTADSLGITADTDDGNFANTTAGSGGVVSGAAAITKTTNTSTTTSRIDSTDENIGTTEITIAGDFAQAADHLADFDTTLTAASGGLLSGTGGDVRNDIVSTVNTVVGANTNITANNIDARATNRIAKDTVGSGGNVNAATGGLVAGGGVASNTNLTLNTNVNIEDNATLTSDADSVELHALNTIDAADQVSVRTGGVAAGGYTRSTVTTLADNATVNIDGTVTSENEINVSARGNADVDLQGNSETYGAATVGTGLSAVDITPDNKINVNEGAEVIARRDLNFSTGTDTAFNRDVYTLKAHNDTFAGSLIPIEDVNAVANLNQTNHITVAAGASVRSGGNMRLHTESNAFATLDTQAKAVTWINAIDSAIDGLFGSGGVEEYGGGETQLSADGQVIVHGILETGIHKDHELIIESTNRDPNAPVPDPDNPDAFVDSPDYYNVVVADPLNPNAELASFDTELTVAKGSLELAIQEAREQRARFLEDPTLRAFYDAEIQRMLELQESQGLAYRAIDKDGNEVLINKSQDALVVSVDPILAEAGSIDIRADEDAQTGALPSSNTSSIMAPSDASVRIINNSPAFLKLNGITIPASNGGLYFNGEDISSQYGVSNTIDPNIVIRNDLNLNALPDTTTSDLPWPSISVSSPISNVNGSLELKTYQNGGGSIEINATIRAKEQVIEGGQSGTVNVDLGLDSRLDGTGRGESSFAIGSGAVPEQFQDFINSDGTVRAEIDGSNGNVTNYLDEVLNPPKVALTGERIFITAQYININDIIKSGEERYNLLLDEDTRVDRIDPSTSTYYRLDDFIEDNRFDATGHPTTGRIDLALRGETNNLGVVYDYDLDRLIVNELSVSGGYVDLTGNITNTRNGEIQVLGDYATVKIDNQFDYDMQVNRLDTSQRGDGTIIIKDLAKGQNVIYTKEGSTIVEDKGLGDRIFHHQSEDIDYEPLEHLKLGWTVIEETLTRKTTRYGSSSLFGFIDFLAPDPDDRVFGPVIKPLSTEIDQSSTRFFVDDDNSDRYNYLPIVDWASSTFDREKQELPSVWTGWWPFRTETVRWNVIEERGTKTFHRHQLAADRPIDIHFLGKDRSSIEITSNGNIFLDEITNPTGLSTVFHHCVSTGMPDCGDSDISILPVSPDSTLGGLRLYVAASNKIGAADLPLRTNLPDVMVHDYKSNETVEVFGGQRVLVLPGHTAGGVPGSVYKSLLQPDADFSETELSVTNFESSSWELVLDEGTRLLTERGDINVEEVSGDFIGRGITANRQAIRTNDGDINIVAPGSIIQLEQSTQPIVGNAINLTAKTGNLGASQEFPLSVDYQNATQGLGDSLNLNAKDDIFLSHTTDLVIDTIVAGGDVWIDGNGTGALIDGNTLEEVDDRAISELRTTVWDALNLTDGDSRLGERRDQIIEAQNAAYNEYWDLRETQSDSSFYNPEHEVFINGEFSQELTDRYHELHAFDPEFVVEISEQEQANIRELGEVRGLVGTELDDWVNDEVERISDYRTHRYREMHNMGSYGDFPDIRIAGQAYNQYWEYRETQDDPSTFDPDHEIVATPEELDRFRAEGVEAGLEGEELEQFVANRATNLYHELHDTYGVVGDVRIESFQYELTLEDVEEIDSTKVWTEEELRSLRSRAFLEVTDTEFALEENNITAGGDITIVNSDGVGRYMNVRRVPVLDAEGEVIGTQLDTSGTTIKLTDDNGDPTVLTLDERAAIDAAEEHDIIYLEQAPVSARAEMFENTITFVNENGEPDTTESWANYGFMRGQSVYIEATRFTTDDGEFFEITGVNGHVLEFSNGITTRDDPSGPAVEFEFLVSNIDIAPVAADPSYATHIRVLHREDIDVNAGGALSANSDRQIFIGSEAPGGLQIDQVSTGPDQRVQIKVEGDLDAVNGQVNIAGGRLVLESSTGSIGHAVIDVSDAGYLIARAEGDIRLAQSFASDTNRLTVDQGFSKTGSFYLTSSNGIRVENGIKAQDNIGLAFRESIAIPSSAFLEAGNLIQIRNYFQDSQANISISSDIDANSTQVAGGNSRDTILFQPHSLTGTATINARGGDDTIYGSQFVETIDGGEGCDTIYSGEGQDTILNPEACDSYGSLNLDSPYGILDSNSNGDSVGSLAMSPQNADDQLTFVLEDDVDGLLAIDGNQIVIADATKILQYIGQQVSLRVRVYHGEGGTTVETFTLDVDWSDITRVLEESIVVGDGTEQRSLVNQLQVTFSGPVDIDATAFKITTQGSDSTIVPTSWTTSFDEFGNTVATLSFSGDQTRGMVGALKDGYYELTVAAKRVRRTGTNIHLDGDGDGVAGGAFAFGDNVEDKFFALYGDFDGDADVDIFDLLKFRQSYNSGIGDENYNSLVDFHSDDRIDIFDLLEFRRRYGTQVTFE
jgi:hypothetical protein